ncbi:TraD N-terminal domain-containing protein [Rickettsia felis]|uniref:TraD N-terminal domain-containing protein n=1 Tax=Rickettsia felis TaxID=42862 RepID=UPI001F34AA28|nr:TraD N-terminal domain-containing protein [Rickettsia felis]
MLTQGITNALTVSLTASCMWLIFRILQKINILSLYYYCIECYVQLKLAVGQYFYDISQIGITFYDVKRQEWIYRSAEDFIHKFWYVTKHGTQITSFGSWLAGSAAFEVLGVFECISDALRKHPNLMCEDLCTSREFYLALDALKLRYSC